MNKDLKFEFPDTVTAQEFLQLLAAMDRSQQPIPSNKIYHVDLRTPEKEAIALSKDLSATARVDGRLVAYLRVLSDDAYLHYIHDVMVHPDWQRQGIGTKLLQLTVERLKSGGFIKILLTAIPGAEGFYEKLGFAPTMSQVMHIRGEDHRTGP